ncbi:MAG: acyl-CoA dehydrogenase family protein [Promethearchaeota archaeon]
MVQEIKKALRALKFSNLNKKTNEMVLDLVDELCIREIDPYDTEMEEIGVTIDGGKVILPPPMPAILVKMAQTDLFGLFAPEEWGGMGLSYALHCAVIERIARSNASISLFLPAHGTALDLILKHGTEEAKEEYLPKLSAGKYFGALAFTEPNSGSDLSSVQCAAEQQNDGTWKITGQKIFITHAGVADLAVGLFSTDRTQGARGLSSFIIDLKQPGVEVGRLERKLGLHGSSTGELIFENYRVPAEHLLGRINKGFPLILRALTGSRIDIAAQSVGIAKAAYKRALEYSKHRKQFNRPVSEFQITQVKLAQMATKIHAARSMYLLAAHHKHQKRPFSNEACMAKLYASEMVQEVCGQAIQIHGGYGFIEEYGVARHYRDARVCTIYEGTSEIQHLIIAKNLLTDQNV